jgi:hypothetical protein
MFSLAALLGGMLFIVLLIGLPVYIFSSLGLWKMFEKAGEDNAALKGFVPFWNTWVRVKISGVKQWFFWIIIGTTLFSFIFGNNNNNSGLYDLIYLAALAANLFCNYNIAKKFGKEPWGYAIGLTLVPVVFYMILGYSKDVNYSNVNVSEYGPIDDKSGNTTNTNTTSTPTEGNQKFCTNCGAPIGDEKFCTKCGKQLH